MKNSYLFTIELQRYLFKNKGVYLLRKLFLILFVLVGLIGMFLYINYIGNNYLYAPWENEYKSFTKFNGVESYKAYQLPMEIRYISGENKNNIIKKQDSEEAKFILEELGKGEIVVPRLEEKITSGRHIIIEIAARNGRLVYAGWGFEKSGFLSTDNKSVILTDDLQELIHQRLDEMN